MSVPRISCEAGKVVIDATNGIYAINLLNVEDAWYEFRNKAFERIAIDWLEENQIPFVRDTRK